MLESLMVQTFIDGGQYSALCRRLNLSVRQSGKWQPGEAPIISYCLGNMQSGGTERIYYLYLEIDCCMMMDNQPLLPYEIHDSSLRDIPVEFDRIVVNAFGRDLGLPSFFDWDCCQIKFCVDVEVYEASRTIEILREAGMKDEQLYADLAGRLIISPSVTTLTVYKKSDMLKFGAFDRKGITVTHELISKTENVLRVSAYARKAQLSRLLHQSQELARPPSGLLTRDRARRLVLSAYRRHFSDALQSEVREVMELEQLLMRALV